MEILSEPLFFQTCQLCDKTFTQGISAPSIPHLLLTIVRAPIQATRQLLPPRSDSTQRTPKVLYFLQNSQDEMRLWSAMFEMHEEGSAMRLWPYNSQWSCDDD